LIPRAILPLSARGLRSSSLERAGRAILLLGLAAIHLAAGASARTLTVRQDGTGDYLTLGEAFTASQPNDTILVGPGTYTEPDLTAPRHPLTILSTHGPGETRFAGYGTMEFGTRDQDSVLDGFTFSKSGLGRAIYISSGARLAIRNCIFEDNLGGALFVAYGYPYETTLVVEDTHFRGNALRADKVTIYALTDVRLSVTRCVFEDNGRAIAAVGSTVLIVDSRFIRNHASAIHIRGSGSFDIQRCLIAENGSETTNNPIVEILGTPGTIENCTFYENMSGGGSLSVDNDGVSVDRNIFYGQSRGAGIYYDNVIGPQAGPHACNLFVRNEGGSIVGDIRSPTDIIADPGFCDAPGGDFGVSTLGRAAPANSPCGELIGAYSPNCDIDPAPPPPPPPPPPQLGSFIVVRKDGTGDFTTITAAAAAATPGDTIFVDGGGAYSESAITFRVHVSLLTSGAGIHGTSLIFRSGPSRIDGFTIATGGITAENANLTVTDCQFIFSRGVTASGSSARLLMSDCSLSTGSDLDGLAVTAEDGARATVTRCNFQGLWAWHYQGLLQARNAVLNIADCLITGTRTAYPPVEPTGPSNSCVRYTDSEGTIKSTTFYGNTTTDAIRVVRSPNVVIEQTIISSHNGNGDEAALRYSETTPGTRSCNIFWDNSGPNVEGDVLRADELVADPRFCNASGGDFGVSSVGPAAPDQSPCGELVGAFPPNCDVPPPPPFEGTRIRVRKDGTGDFLTMTEALDASTPGDTIEIGPGTYTEAPLIGRHSITFESTDGPGATTLNGWLGIRWLPGSTVVVDGLRFADCRHPDRDAAVMGDEIDLTVRNSIFENNLSGSIIVFGNSTAVIENTRFAHNDGASNAVYAVTSSVSIRDCEFVDNSWQYSGGAIELRGAQATVAGCRFADNVASGTGAAAVYVRHTTSIVDVTQCLFMANRGRVIYNEASGSVENCTFYGNEDADGIGSVHIASAIDVAVNRNIFFGQTGGYAIAGGGGQPSHACNIFWQNELGPISGDTLSATDIIVDPMFCDAPGGDLTVSTSGPAAAQNSACSLLIGAFGTGCNIEPPPPPPSEAPVILAVNDVPDDEGGQVRIRWSGIDHVATDPPVTSYAVYRQSEGSAAWSHLLTVPASGDSVYAATIGTSCESALEDPCCNPFMVSALTTDTLLHFESLPDTGCSTDDLRPDPPENLVASVSSPGIMLEWAPSPAPDIVVYRVYRDPAADFDLDPSSFLAETADTEWHDPAGTTSHGYSVIAVDGAGNESEPVTASAEAPAGAVVFALGQNEPNPFNPSTLIPYSVGPGGGQVTLRVYDVAGRLVATLIDEVQSPGPKTVRWNGIDKRGEVVTSGVYFYRITAPGFEETRKMALIR